MRISDWSSDVCSSDLLARLDPTMTVLDYLRQVEHLSGTKEGCNEGDCGACTVVLARPQGERMRYQAVNACIQLLGTLDGCKHSTVEHLAKQGRLHPVQQARWGASRVGKECVRTCRSRRWPYD